MTIDNFTVNPKNNEVSFTYDGNEYTFGCQVNNGVESPLTEDQAIEKVKDLLARPPLSKEESDFLNLRRVRNNKLTESDWRMTIDYAGTDQEEWKTYRQALRDITNTYSSLDDVVWPETPA